ncbi:MAG: PLP-dependent aminotransferase family protein [Spirochaetes bacterium]|nr:PLP-dependent aminotransferase family protein [Spirochaetota bacterium]
MDYQNIFSSNAKKMKSSKIRELMKYASMPDVISFSGGIPDPQHFPYQAVSEIIQKWDDKKAQVAMQYGTTTGYPPLVNNLKKRMENLKNINLSGQDLMITSGGQQALFLVSRIFVDPNDCILVEGPSFIGGIAAFLSHQANPIEIPLEDDGINLTILEDKLKECQEKNIKIKFLYTIPNFQNPGGVTLSQEKRKKLYDLSLKYNLVILEDDPYGDLFFEGTPQDYQPIKALGNEAPIIYISSFSKILSPGLRLGWCVADHELIEKMALAKQSVDACSQSYGQIIANDYLEKNIIDDYVETMKKIYKHKKEFMVEEIKKYFPLSVKYTNPNGGFFIYLTLPDKISSEALFKKVIEKNVAFVTGDPFHIDKVEADKHIRLAYSNSSEEQIKEGIKIIGETIKSML